MKWCIFGLLAGYAAVAAVWARGEADRHVCTGVEIQVASASGAMDSTVRHGVREELARYPKKIIGQPMRQVSTGDVERFLTRRANFESVHCMMSSRGKLVVRVEPLVPVMRVFYAGSSYYINKHGKHMLTNAEFPNDVPLVTGRFNRSFTPSGVLPLVEFVRKDPLLSELTGMIVADTPHDLIIVPKIRGHVVNFGDTTRLEEKKRALTMFYRQVMPYKGWEEYDTVSVKFRGQVVATRRDKSRLNHAEEYLEDVDLEEATLPDAVETASQAAESAGACQKQKI